MDLYGIEISQEMTNREYLEDQDAEEPDDFIISLTAQVSTTLFPWTNTCTSQKACTLLSPSPFLESNIPSWVVP